MRVLLVDTETSGLSYEAGARVLEVAAALFDTKYASVIESFSTLIAHDENDAEHVNGIPVGLLMEHGDDPLAVWLRFVHLAKEAECVVAHRAEFDQGFVQKSLDALESPDSYDVWEDWDPSKPWVCTKSDIEWPGKLRGDSLVQLALGLGLGVASAHRAASDVDTMARCLTRAREVLREEVRQICDLIPRKDERGKYTVGEALDIEPKLKAMYDGSPRIRGLLDRARNDSELECGDLLESLFRRAMRPKVRVVAQVSFEQKDMAKEAGFFWSPERREWYRMMPPEDIAALPFRAVVRA